MISKNHLQNLGFTKQDSEDFEKNKVKYMKKINDFMKQARKDAKPSNCYYCGQPCTSFCNSHSVPRFCLNRIAVDGFVYYANTLINAPIFDVDKGVASSGTFRIICRECDSKIFQDYENSDNYINRPTGRMLAQIALKNYLLRISKRLLEISLYNKITNELGHDYSHMQHVNHIDLQEYEREYNYAKKAFLSKWDDNYYMAYYKKLDYVVPIAFQGCITIIADFEGVIINDIYNYDLNYSAKDIHICIFPFQDYSVVILFNINGEKRYRKFYKQFNKLSENDKLSAINFILFSYSEDIFIYRDINTDLINNAHLQEVAKQTANILTHNPYINPIEAAMNAFDLRKRSSIPNFLSEENKIISL